jgi:hypothetical protein
MKNYNHSYDHKYSSYSKKVFEKPKIKNIKPEELFNNISGLEDWNKKKIHYSASEIFN